MFFWSTQSSTLCFAFIELFEAALHKYFVSHIYYYFSAASCFFHIVYIHSTFPKWGLANFVHQRNNPKHLAVFKADCCSFNNEKKNVFLFFTTLSTALFLFFSFFIQVKTNHLASAYTIPLCHHGNLSLHPPLFTGNNQWQQGEVMQHTITQKTLQQFNLCPNIWGTISALKTFQCTFHLFWLGFSWATVHLVVSAWWMA